MKKFQFVVDNLGGNTLDAILRSNVRPNSTSSFASAYFTVSGFNLIADQLMDCQSFRLLLGAEPGTRPLELTSLDLWKNIDIRQSPRQAERAVDYFSRDNVQIRLHGGPFFHGKTYILNHPKPKFEDLDAAKDAEPKQDWEVGERPARLKFIGDTPTQTDGVSAIVGSSNFTYGGLTKNRELNLLDPAGESLIELLTWYEERWEESRDFKEEFLKLLRGYYKPFSPFWIYAKALYELYKEDLEEGEFERPGSKIELADFQRAGFKAARRILEQWNGALISDSPGLGKTYIAGKLLEEYAYYQREKALIICPAEVESIWKRFASSYNIPVADYVHTEILGRGVKDGSPRVPPARFKDHSFVLVDESHHFRNPNAGRYIWFQELMALPTPIAKVEGKMEEIDRKVVFVTATPVNNSVWDLYWQFALLFGEGFIDIAARQGITDLREYFKNAQTGYGNLYDLIEKVSVRRSRVFIREFYPHATLEGKPVTFPERRLESLYYHLHPSLGNLYSDAVTAIEKCKLVPYRTETYRIGEKDEAKIIRGDILTVLFKILLLKRLESSLIAFRETVQGLVTLFKTSLDCLEQGYVLPAGIARDYENLLESTQEDGIDIIASLPEGEISSAEEFYGDQMAKQIESDISSLERFLDLIPENASEMAQIDEKLKAMKASLKESKQRTIIFTSFVDTANYLFKELQEQGLMIGLVTGDDSRLWERDSELPSKRADLITRFSPVSNEAEIAEKDQIDLLVSTDVLSEAINLQDAKAVLNYDLPWNPMKLVQRAGRIDRMKSEHKEVVVYNIFPEADLEELLKLSKKLQDKIEQTHRSVGLEWSILGEEPLPIDFATTVERVRKRDPTVMIDIEKKMEGLMGLDPQEQLLAILQTMSREQLERIPDGAGSVTTGSPECEAKTPGFFVAYRLRRSEKDVDKIWRFYPQKGEKSVSNKTQIVEQIRHPKQHPAVDRFGDDSLQLLKDIRLRLESELKTIEVQQRTQRKVGLIRKAFDLVERKGRADLDRFLQSAWTKPAIQRKLRKIRYKNEDEAIQEIEGLMEAFGNDIETTSPDIARKTETDKLEPHLPKEFEEIQPLPEGYNPALELVCWMHLKREEGKEKVEDWMPLPTGQKKFTEKGVDSQSKMG